MANLGIYGVLIAICTMVSYHLGLTTNAATASTMAFATLTIARLFHGFNCRSTHSVFGCPISRNWWCMGAFVVGLLLINMVLFIPGLHSLFEVADLTGAQIGWIYLMAFVPTLVVQIFKLVREHLPAAKNI